MINYPVVQTDSVTLKSKIVAFRDCHLETVAPIAWMQQVEHGFQGQGHSFKVKCHRAKKHASAHLPYMENAHTQIGDCISNSQGVAGGTRIC